MNVSIQCTKWVVVTPAEQKAAAAAFALILTAGTPAFTELEEAA